FSRRRNAALTRTAQHSLAPTSWPETSGLDTDGCARDRAYQASGGSAPQNLGRSECTSLRYDESSYGAVLLGPTGPRNLMKIYLAVRSQPPGAARSRTHWRSRSRGAVGSGACVFERIIGHSLLSSRGAAIARDPA